MQSRAVHRLPPRAGPQGVATGCRATSGPLRTASLFSLAELVVRAAWRRRAVRVHELDLIAVLSRIGNAVVVERECPSARTVVPAAPPDPRVAGRVACGN